MSGRRRAGRAPSHKPRLQLPPHAVEYGRVTSLHATVRVATPQRFGAFMQQHDRRVARAARAMPWVIAYSFVRPDSAFMRDLDARQALWSGGRR